MKRAYLGIAALSALMLATVASGAPTATPGITRTQVVIGGTVPLSGPAAAYASVAKGAQAYFKYVNAHGGVNHRKIKHIIKDDAYDPAQTTDKTKELVQQDHVFAIFNSLGTGTNLAVRPYLNAIKVPQLFVASGATTWGRDYKKYQWTIGYQPNYRAEGTIYGRYVAKTNPRAKIGVLYQNDDYGKDLLKGLTNGLGSKAKLIVSKQSYEVTDDQVSSQIAKLKAKKAKTLMVFATLGTSKKQTEGSISIVFLKDPTDAHWKRDPGMKLYRSIMKRYKGGNPNDVYNVYGMSAAHTFVAALKKAGKSPTRDSIKRAATHLTVKNDPFLLPGITVQTTSSDHFPIDQARLERYHNGHWVVFGGLFRVR